MSISTISTSTTITQSTLANYTWPVTINGGTSSNPVVVKFGSNLQFTDSQHYFIFGSEYVTLDGSWNTIDISGVHGGGSGYYGLVDNGNRLNVFYGNTVIENIGITVSSGTILNGSASWFLQQGYSANTPSGVLTVQNCYSTGDMNDYTGGIVFQNSGYNENTKIVVKNCYSLGAIAGDSAGGIVGPNAGNGGASLQIINCYSAGSITGSDAGGIVGASVGVVDISHCYVANGNWNSTNANAVLQGTDGSIWNTSVTPYTLMPPAPYVPPPCLLTGTRVKTPRGYIPIEKIKVGDSIISNLNLSVKVVEVGRWKCSTRNSDLSSKMYKIPAGKFGAKDDIYLSYYHRVLMNNCLNLPVNLDLKEADPSSIVESDGHSFMLYHLRVEKGESNLLVVNGGCFVESWVDIV